MSQDLELGQRAPRATSGPREAEPHWLTTISFPTALGGCFHCCNTALNTFPTLDHKRLRTGGRCDEVVGERPCGGTAEGTGHRPREPGLSRPQCLPGRHSSPVSLSQGPAKCHIQSISPETSPLRFFLTICSKTNTFSNILKDGFAV